MAVNTTVGQPARGNEYFDRPQLTGRLWKKIESGSNVLITAPRRVGKSSIMFFFLDNPPQGFRLTFLDTESVSSENEFYKKLLHHILDTLKKAGKAKKMKQGVRETISRIEAIGPEGITLGDSRLNYYDELIKLLKSLDFEGDRLVIMLDEFAETVQNIIKDESQEKAIRFLQGNRALRLMPELEGRVQYIIAGSIGLENIVDRLDAPGTINDLYSFPIPPLSKTGAKALIDKVLTGSGYSFKERPTNYMLNKLKWLIPFYIQLMVDEIDKLELPGEAPEIKKKDIDRAFDQAIEHRNYFSNWHTRLRRSYSGPEYTFVKELLNYISEKDTVTSSDISDLAVKHGIEDGLKNILNTLKYDGYINNNEDPKVYRFNSPILKLWWYKNVAY